MNGSNAIDLVDWLVLARLLVAGEKGATASEIKKALDPLLGHRWTGGALTERLTQALTALVSAGLATRTRKGKTERDTLTPEGERRALEFLGLEHLPPKTKWDNIKDRLAIRALGLPAPGGEGTKRLGQKKGFEAAILKAQFGLPVDDYPTFTQAIDALVWQLMGFEPGKKLALKAVKAALIRRELEGRRQVDPKADPEKEVLKLLAKKLSARKSGKKELGEATIRQGVDAANRISEAIAAPASTPPVPLDLDTFSRRVIEAARRCPTGRFGNDKVFVVHVFRSLSVDPTFAAMGLDSFKQRLAEANNARRLDLSRANMVEAMDPSDVELSRVAYLGAEFHFICI